MILADQAHFLGKGVGAVRSAIRLSLELSHPLHEHKHLGERNAASEDNIICIKNYTDFFREI
jgi:hypothetical protein